MFRLRIYVSFILHLTTWQLFIMKMKIISVKYHYPGIRAIILLRTCMQISGQWLSGNCRFNNLFLKKPNVFFLILYFWNV